MEKQCSSPTSLARAPRTRTLPVLYVATTGDDTSNDCSVAVSPCLTASLSMGGTGLSADGTDFGVIGRGINDTSVGVKAESKMGVALQVEVLALEEGQRCRRQELGGGHHGRCEDNQLGRRHAAKSVAGVYVAAVPTAGKVTIHLNKTVTAAIPVGFLVIN